MLHDINLVKKPMKCEFINYDTPPLARVIAFKRSTSPGFYDPLMPLKRDAVYLSNDEVQVSANDIAQSLAISEYYKNKLVIRALSGEQAPTYKLTKSTFDRDLGMALRLNDENTSKEEYFPILHRLPDFYVEDLAVDDLVRDHESHQDMPQYMLGSVMVVGTLRFVCKVSIKKRAYNVISYYFADQNNQLVRIPVPKDSVILPLMNLLEQAKSFIMTGNTMSKRIHRDYRDFEVLEPAGIHWNITDLEM